MDEINILNNQLAKHNIRIKKAKLEFCYKLGSRNITQDFPPEILLENIFLKSKLNVFQHFQFVELNNNGNIIRRTISDDNLNDNNQNLKKLLIKNIQKNNSQKIYKLLVCN